MCYERNIYRSLERIEGSLMVHPPRESQQWEAISNLRPAEEAKVLDGPQESFRAVLSSFQPQSLARTPGWGRSREWIKSLDFLSLYLPLSRTYLDNGAQNSAEKEDGWRRKEEETGEKEADNKDYTSQTSFNPCRISSQQFVLLGPGGRKYVVCLPLLFLKFPL